MDGFDLSTVDGIYLGNDLVEAYYGEQKIWPTHDYTLDYLTIESLEDNNTIGWAANGATKTISYSTDGGTTWTQLSSSDTITTLDTGDAVILKGTNNSYAEYIYNTNQFNYFTTTGDCKVYGNIMSLIYGDNFTSNSDFPSGSYMNFYGLFAGTDVVSAKDLILPATTLTSSCYEFMFGGCYWLTQAPNLPATTLAPLCYGSMFEDCSSLTKAPKLPATVMQGSGWGSGCYNSMFKYCSSLTNVSDMQIATLATGCCASMFEGCSSLVNAPRLLASTVPAMQPYCFASMFSGCSSLLSAANIGATTLAEGCFHSMYNGCTSLVNAGALPATTLATNCYRNMFASCTSLVTPPQIPATTLAQQCCYYMFYACTSLTKSPKLPATTLAYESYFHMFDGCTSLSEVICLATDLTAQNCTSGWLNNVSATGTFIKDGSMTSWTTGNDGIPSGWTVKDYDLYYYSYFTANNPHAYSIGFLFNYGSNISNPVYYSIDDGSTWTEWPNDTYVYCPAESSLLVKGNITGNTYSGSASFSCLDDYTISGNIMSWLYGDNFVDTAFTNSHQYVFNSLFGGDWHLISAENLILPATNTVNRVYRGMFEYCANLTKGPKIMATTLYGGYDLEYMFNYCSSLEYIYCMVNWGSNTLSGNWVISVASSGTFVKNPNMNWWYGDNAVPNNWTIVDAS